MKSYIIIDKDTLQPVRTIHRLTIYVIYFLLILSIATIIGLGKYVAVLENSNKNLTNSEMILSDSLENIIRLERSEHLYYQIGYYLTTTVTQPCSDSLMFDLLETVGAWYPEIILAQAKLESANYGSQVFKTNNNPFGMKCVYKRPTTQTCHSAQANTTYGYYRNWQTAVLDRVLWDLYTFKEKPTLSDYKTFIGRTYAEDSSYIRKLEGMIKTF